MIYPDFTPEELQPVAPPRDPVTGRRIDHLYAVCWIDFVPLHVYAKDAESAIQRAKEMAARSAPQGILPAAMSLDPYDDLTVLWAAEGFTMTTEGGCTLRWCEDTGTMALVAPGKPTDNQPKGDANHG